MTERIPDDLLDALVTTSFDVMSVMTQIAGAHDLSLTQVRVMAILRDRRPRMSELADYLGLDRSTVSGLIDRAVSRGLIERVADQDDGRAARVQLTTEGRALALAATHDIRAGISPLVSGLSSAERDRLLALLTARSAN